MKFKYVLFVIALCTCALPVYDAYAKRCDPGEFLMTNKCFECRSGCYCHHNNWDRNPLDPEDEITTGKEGNVTGNTVAAWCARNTDTCSNHNQDGYGEKSEKGNYYQCGKSDEAEVYRCPDDFPKSDPGSKYLWNCYTKVGSKKLYYRLTTCESGTYLPKNSGSCVSCDSGSYCPGVEVYPSTTEDQGRETCPSGQKPNADHTGCESNKNYTTSTELDTDSPLIVQKGYYLPANKSVAEKCVATTKYCPGGVFSKSNKDQGIYDCPKIARANDEKSACKMALTKTQMEKGLNADSKCWIYVDSQNYLDCLGIDIAE